MAKAIDFLMSLHWLDGQGVVLLNGFKTGIGRSRKCFTFRVAIVAPVAMAMPLIKVSRRSTGVPSLFRVAASRAAYSAARALSGAMRS